MGFDEEAVTDEQREACAVVVMRTMLEDWCDDTGAPFDDALDAFASSRTYELPASGPKAPTTSASCGSRRRRTASRSAWPRPGPLSPRPTAHHGNISHYVLIYVSSSTFTSLFLYSRRKDGRGALFEEFKGALTEQYACQELIASCGLVTYY